MIAHELKPGCLFFVERLPGIPDCIPDRTTTLEAINVKLKTALFAEAGAGNDDGMKAAEKGQRVTVFRPASIYGPGDLRLLKLFKTIHNGKFRMIGPGAVHFHTVYIDDLVDGIIRCGTNDAALGEIFILAGPSCPTSRKKRPTP